MRITAIETFPVRVPLVPSHRMVSNLGRGIGKARRIAELAGRHGVACTIGSNLERDVGTAAMLNTRKPGRRRTGGRVVSLAQ